MIFFLKKWLVLLVVISGAVYFMGCSEPGKEAKPDFLMKTPSMTVSSTAFLEELDLKKAAYPYNISENPAEYNEMVIHLVKMLSQEIVLLSAAADRGVVVTDQEVQSAEDEYKTDYPEDSFDQILLKNAISYSFWKKRFKKNMIIEKFIDQELRKKIEIAPQEIVEFYNKHRMAEDRQADETHAGLEKIEDENELVARLRMQKTQDQYDVWIEQLRKEYPVEINEERLKGVLIDVEKNEGSENEK